MCFDMSCQFPNPYCSMASRSRISSLADHLFDVVGAFVVEEELFSLEEEMSWRDPGNSAKLPES